MTTQLFADTRTMNAGHETENHDGSENHAGLPHEPRSRRTETPEQRRARIEAITRAVRNGTYDSDARARLGADGLFRALTNPR